MKENKSKYAIMGMLSMGPVSGYDIKKRFEESLSYFWNESYGQIYPILKKITQTGACDQIDRETDRQTGPSRLRVDRQWAKSAAGLDGSTCRSPDRTS